MIVGVPNAKNKRLRTRVFDRDGNRCRYCGVETTDKEGPYQRTIDHFIPQVLNGPDSIDNCFCCCYGCNMEKSEDDPREEGSIWIPIPLPELPVEQMIRLSDIELATLVAWSKKNKKVASIKTVIEPAFKTSYLRITEENYRALAELARIRKNDLN